MELGRCRLPVEAWLLAPCLTLQLPRSGPRFPGSPAGCQVPGPCPHLVPQASDGRRRQRPRSKGQWWWGGSIPTSLLGLRAQGAHWGRCFVRPMWHSEWTTGSFPLAWLTHGGPNFSHQGSQVCAIQGALLPHPQAPATSQYALPWQGNPDSPGSGPRGDMCPAELQHLDLCT